MGFQFILNGELEVRAGNNLNLVVSVFSFNIPTSTRWTRDGRRVLGTMNSRITSHTSTTITLQNTLLLKNVVPRDAGNYTLTATNPLVVESKQFLVVVTGWFNLSKKIIHLSGNFFSFLFTQDPVVLVLPTADTAVTRDEGRMLTLFCVATGFPAPSITWFPGAGGRKMVTPGIMMEDGEGFISINSTLTIPSLNRIDTGDYACSASNSLAGSNVTRVFTVTVNCKPSTMCVCVCVCVGQKMK